MGHVYFKILLQDRCCSWLSGSSGVLPTITYLCCVCSELVTPPFFVAAVNLCTPCFAQSCQPSPYSCLQFTGVFGSCSMRWHLHCPLLCLLRLLRHMFLVSCSIAVILSCNVVPHPWFCHVYHYILVLGSSGILWNSSGDERTSGSPCHSYVSGLSAQHNTREPYRQVSLVHAPVSHVGLVNPAASSSGEFRSRHISTLSLSLAK